MPIAGVVIIYHPDEDSVLSNIKSYISYFDTLIVFANSRVNDGFVESIKELSEKIVFIFNQKNEGISKALNTAVKKASDQGYAWLLTMDQDSYFEEAEGKAYFEQFEMQFYNSANVAIVSPNHGSNNSEQRGNLNAAREVESCITSGSLINLRICNELGGFDEKLFIDEVDMDYSYRCVLAGYKLIQLSNIKLNHQLGTKVQAGYFNLIKRSNRSIHSPFRIYFMVRNFSYVSSKYAKLLPDEFRVRRRGFYVILKNNLLFSGKFFSVLVAIIKGYLHFKMNKFSNDIKV
jgi:rhamnosyltransferase